MLSAEIFTQHAKDAVLFVTCSRLIVSCTEFQVRNATEWAMYFKVGRRKNMNKFINYT